MTELEDQIAKEFNKWFQEDLYGPFSFRIEHFYEDCEVEDVKTRIEYLRKWMVASFHEGYERGRYAELEAQQNQEETTMTEEQKEQLNKIAEELGSKVEHYICADLYTEHKKIVITYDAKSKRQDS